MMIIKARFPQDSPEMKTELITGRGLNDELVASVREHRKTFGICSKFQLLRGFLKTRQFVKTILPDAA